VGRKITDGNAIDVTAPAGTFEKGELYRIDGFSGFAMDEILPAETDRFLSLDVAPGVWSVKTPAGTASAVRGDFLGWASGTGTKLGPTQLDQVIVQPAAGGVPDAAVVQVETPRNSRGYTRVKLVATS
jgi:hypothetical protein